MNTKTDISLGSDLPDKLVDQLSFRAQETRGIQAVVLRLIGEHPGIDVNGVMIGYYRSSDEVLSRRSAINAVGRLKDKGMVVKGGRGRSGYNLTEHGQSIYDKACGK